MPLTTFAAATLSEGCFFYALNRPVRDGDRRAMEAHHLPPTTLNDRIGGSHDVRRRERCDDGQPVEAATPNEPSARRVLPA